jgi:hypothetical protein
MPDGDQKLAQSIYLANMFAQRGTCQCRACQLLRQSTDEMINQVLGKLPPTQGMMDPTALTKAMGGGDPGTEGGG